MDTMTTLFFHVEVMDSNCDNYRNSDFRKVQAFKFEKHFNYYNDDLLKQECKRMISDFEAIAKNNSKIEVNVYYYSDISQTFPCILTERNFS